MNLSRRKFVSTIGTAAGAMAMVGLAPRLPRYVGRDEAGSLPAKDVKALIDIVLSEANALGCSYADVSITRRRNGSVSRRTDSGPKGTRSVSAEIESERLSFGVRVVHSSGWGFANSSTLTKDEIARTTGQAVANARANAALKDRPTMIIPGLAAKDRWVTPDDSLERHMGDQLASLEAADNDAATTFAAEETFFVSSKGSFVYSTELSVA